MDWSTLTVLHAVPTLCMVGVIWLVQLLVYPAFAFVAPEAFAAFEAAHKQRIGRVVMPLMLLEVALCAALCWQAETAAQQGLAWAGAALLALVWVSTFFVQVPLHERLSTGWDADAARRLVVTNWWRTAAWTLRGGVALALVMTAS